MMHGQKNIKLYSECKNLSAVTCLPCIRLHGT